MHFCCSFEFLSWLVHLLVRLLVHFLLKTGAMHLPLGLTQFDMLVEHLVRDFSCAVFLSELSHDFLSLGFRSRRGMIPGVVNIRNVQVIHIAFAGLAGHPFVEGTGVLPCHRKPPGAMLAPICRLHFKLFHHSRSRYNSSGILQVLLAEFRRLRSPFLSLGLLSR